MNSTACAPWGSGRVTEARREIVRALEGMSAVFTAEELFDALRGRGSSAGKATVYRSLATLEANGYVERVGVRGTSAVYAHCSEGQHHHHLICTACGSVSHTSCPIDESALAEAGQGGFVVTGHDVVLYGLCPACASREGGA